MTTPLRLFGGQAGEGGAHLPAHERIGETGLVLLQVLAHADDRLQPVPQGDLELLVDHLVGLGEELPPLGVADDDVLDPARQHRCRDLAGVGAALGPMQVLGADAHRDVPQRLDDGRQGDERRAHDRFHLRVRCDLRVQRLHELHCLCRRLVHLPVAGQNWFTHECPILLSASRTLPC